MLSSQQHSSRKQRYCRCAVTLPTVLFVTAALYLLTNVHIGQHQLLVTDRALLDEWENGVPASGAGSQLRSPHTINHQQQGTSTSASASASANDEPSPSTMSQPFASAATASKMHLIQPKTTDAVTDTNTDATDSNSNYFLQRTSGTGWQMWDRSSVLFEGLNLTCNWNDYRPYIMDQPRRKGEQSIAVPFCAHPLEDDKFVSNNIVTKGRHLECDSLPQLLSHSLSKGSKATAQHPEQQDKEVIYVDIGANMGTCVMQMLLTTNATIVAFEPHPYNLFVMTSTFMKLSAEQRQRIHLFPIALGAESSDSTIHMASDNRGHAVVSKVIRINNHATFLQPMPIRVEPLDSIFRINDNIGDNNQASLPTATKTSNANHMMIHLIKMDAQGFECYIFQGMKRVLQQTRAVFFELEKKVLNGFDRCSPQVLWDDFQSLDFSMHVGGFRRPAVQEMPLKGKINIVALNL